MKKIIVSAIIVLEVIQSILIAWIIIAVIKFSFNIADYIQTNGLKAVISEIWEGENNGN